MKSLLTFTCTIGLLWLLASCGQTDTSAGGKAMSDTAHYTTVQWQDTVVNFDTINQGEKATVVFRFRNTGSQPLVLADVRAGCGCTVADYTKGAVPPGGEGEVKGVFDSNRSQAGTVRKNILVTTNTRNGSRHTLIFTGFVKEKKV